MVKRILILIASVVGAISTFLPWATFNAAGFGETYSSSANGTSGDGIMTLVIFVVIGVITLIGVKKPLPTWAKIAITALGVICSFIAIADIANASRLGIGSSYSAFGANASTSIGVGLVLIPIASIANIIISWLPLDKKAN